MAQADVERLLKQIGLRPQQAAGQNFLLAAEITKRMVAAAGLTKSDVVLEIGPGLGILTKEILATGAKVVAVELDQRLFTYLQKRFVGQKNLTLVQADIFKINLNEYVQDGRYKLVANLPYSGTSLVFRNFLSLSPRPTSLTVMIQREVAKRITAEPGELSLLSVMIQYYSRADYLFDVPRHLFFPAPQVDSAVIQCRISPWPDQAQIKKFFQIVRAGFSGRRKQLHNTLAAGLHRPASQVDKILAKAKVDGKLRPQDLTLADWLTLAKNID